MPPVVASAPRPASGRSGTMRRPVGGGLRPGAPDITDRQAALRRTMRQERFGPMKFTDGYWLTREGFTVERPAEAYDVRQLEDRLQILAPTRPIHTRGDTLNRST